MTDTLRVPAVSSTVDGRDRRHCLVGGLAITQTVGYGVLFYAFSVLLAPMAYDLRASAAAVTGALTTSIVVAAAAAIPIGRWLDRHGGRTLMTAGSALGVLAVLAWSQVQHLWQLYAVFVAIGLAGAGSLYEAAFPVVIAATAPERRHRALLAVTIVAGFASSVFFPTTGLLLEHLGWRDTLLVLAGVLAVVAVPLHALVVPGRPSGRGTHHSHVDSSAVRAALRDARFWMLGAAFVAQAAATAAVGVLLVTYLRYAGHATSVAAALSGLLGVLSVTGRLVTTGAARRYGMAAVSAAIFAIQAIGVAALPHLGRSALGAGACVVAFGLGFGVATIARPAITADRYGTTRYATIAATMTVPITLAKAFAPLGAAALPPDAFLYLAGAACLASAVLLWTTARAGMPRVTG